MQLAAAATGRQQTQASTDAVAPGVGLVLFWPAMLRIGGDMANAAEIARLKGGRGGIQKVNAGRSCGIQFRGRPGAHLGDTPN